jgi:hypothetical protein
MTKTDLAILTGDIDAAAATIKNVSVITVGEARGHGMQIDEKTLLQVKAAAETYAGGLKVKTDHYSGFNEIVGALKNFSIDGDQLRADLFLLKNHDATARILEMAELMPDTFGLSISFSGDHEESGETVFARCSEIYSADLVDAPAANPTGLFSAKVDSNYSVMTPEEVSAAISEALAPVMAEIAALKEAAMPHDASTEGDMPSIEISASNTPVDKTAMSELATELASIKAIVSNFGAVPAPVSVASDKAADVSEPTNFQQALDKVKSEGLTGIAATKETINRYPTLFVEARNNGIRTL